MLCILQDNVCGIDDERLTFTGSNPSLEEYILTPPFQFQSNIESEQCLAPCLGGYSDDFDSRYIKAIAHLYDYTCML